MIDKLEQYELDRLEEMTRAFIRTILWSNTIAEGDLEGYDEWRESQGETDFTPAEEMEGDNWDRHFDVDDLFEGDALKIRTLIERWCAKHASLLVEYYERVPARRRCSDGERWTVAESCGHDLALTAQRCGVGFWDRKELEEDDLGARLSKAANDMPAEYMLFIPTDEQYAARAKSPAGVLRIDSLDWALEHWKD